MYTYCLSVNISAGTDVGRGSLKQPAISYLQLLSLRGLSDQSLWMYGHAWGKSPRHAQNPYAIGQVKLSYIIFVCNLRWPLNNNKNLIFLYSIYETH